MKNKTINYVLIGLFVTLIGLWALPELIKTATYSKTKYPFGYYSSIEKKLMFRELDGRKDNLHDDEGKLYEDKAFDAALPLLNFRQLMLNGEMLDSIDGIKIEPQQLRVKQVVYRYTPKHKNVPDIGLYIMYESLPQKGKLESPGDLFRLKDKIEFIDAETNTVNREKSEKFQNALLKAGYVFPAQWTAGDLSIRKPYDEGYFSLDAKGQLFHIKRVNGRPFVRNTQLDPQIEPAFFAMEEPADKRFYGFLFDKKGKVYILEEAGGKYHPRQLDIDPIRLDTDELSLIGNFLYWTITVQNPAGKQYYALKTETLEKVRYAFVAESVNPWDVIAGKLFPFYLTFRNPNSEYIAPQLHFTTFMALITNVVLALIFAGIYRRRSVKKKIFDSSYVLIFGIAGAIALLLQWKIED
ncbi:MAG: DUF4857 domain-containing protein [Dysgonamonadaceae bacterium]|jgi:hypothetical protein|nr:DUF4857 domain-containing protein [Dysgonamonadaceae bacterium]